MAIDSNSARNCCTVSHGGLGVMLALARLLRTLNASTLLGLDYLDCSIEEFINLIRV